MVRTTHDAVTPALAWVPLLGGDPLAWLLASHEPAARWVTLTGVLDRPGHDPQVAATRAAVVADPATQELLGRLPDWEAGERLSGHDSPRFAPNLLNLLADMGVQEGDDRRGGVPAGAAAGPPGALWPVPVLCGLPG